MEEVGPNMPDKVLPDLRVSLSSEWVVQLEGRECQQDSR